MRKNFRSDISIRESFYDYDQSGERIQSLVPENVRIEYFTPAYPRVRLVCSRNGDTFHNCSLSENGRVLVCNLALSRQSLGVGPLLKIVKNSVADSSFPYDFQNKEHIASTGIDLWGGPSDAGEFESESVLSEVILRYGYSAYRLAVLDGFEGTEQEWLESLIGNGIQSVEQTQSSQESEGENVVTVTMTDGSQAQFSIRNGKQGERGLQGVPGVANAKYKQVDTLPTASADTMDFIYLTPTQTAGVYDMSYTEQDGNTYTWKPFGTTAIRLADYATKAEVNQLEAKVGETSGGGEVREDLQIEWTSGKAIVANSSNVNFGKETSSATQSISGYVDVSQYAGKTLNYTRKIVPSSAGGSKSYGLVFFSDTGSANAISGQTFKVEGESTSYELTELEIPSNAKYVRFTFQTEFIANWEAYVMTEGEVIYTSGLGKRVQDLDAEMPIVQSNLGYYVCNTGAATAEKIVNAPGYSLIVGGAIRVKFNYNNSVSGETTLNINNTGAKPLVFNKIAASSSNSWRAGEVVDIYYDGTNFQAYSHETINNLTSGGLSPLAAEQGKALSWINREPTKKILVSASAEYKRNSNSVDVTLTNVVYYDNSTGSFNTVFADGDVESYQPKTFRLSQKNGRYLVITSGGEIVYRYSNRQVQNTDIILLSVSESDYSDAIGGALYPDYVKKYLQDYMDGELVEKDGFKTASEYYAWKKAEQFTKLKWTPLKGTIQKASSTAKFTANVEQTGMPYSSVAEYDKRVGYDVSLHTFMTALHNPYSLMYTECVRAGYSQSAYGRTYYGAANSGPFYGMVCSVYTGHALAIPVPYVTGRFSDLAGEGGILEKVYDQSANGAKRGDIIWMPGHVVFVKDVWRRKGVVTQVLISEEGQPKAVDKPIMTAEDFNSYMEGKILYRYKELYKNIHYEASPFVAVGDETPQDFEYNDDICTFAGDKAAFAEGELIYIHCLNLDYPQMEIYKDDVLVETITLASDSRAALTSDELAYAVNLSNDGLTYGKYKCRLKDGDTYSDYTYFEVLDVNLEISGDTASYSSANANALYWYWNEYHEPDGARIYRQTPLPDGSSGEFDCSDRKEGYPLLKVIFAGDYGCVAASVLEDRN